MRRRKASGLLIASSALGGLLLLSFTDNPVSNSVQAFVGGTSQQNVAVQTSTSQAVQSGTINLHFYKEGTTEINPAKLRPGNFGPPVTTDQTTEVQESTEAIRSENPFTTASHVAQHGWASAKPEDITALGERYKQNPNEWSQALTQLRNWERDPNTKVSIEVIPGPYASYYMETGRDAQSVIIKHDSNVHPDSGDKMIVYRNGNTIIMRALSCEQQPIAFGVPRMPDKFTPTPYSPPPGSTTPPIGTGGCTYGPCSETPSTPTTPSTSTTTTTTPNCYQTGECKSTNSSDYPYPSGKPKVTESRTADNSPPKVETTRTTSQVPIITPNGPEGSTPVNPGPSSNNGSIPPSNSGPNCNPRFDPNCPGS